MSGNAQAPEGTIYVCGACGKTSRWAYGFDEKGNSEGVASHGWDESCAMHAVLCHEEKDADGHWVSVAKTAAASVEQ